MVLSSILIRIPGSNCVMIGVDSALTSSSRQIVTTSESLFLRAYTLPDHSESSMQLHCKHVVAALLALILAPSTYAVTVAKTRTIDVNSSVSGTNYQVPYFTQSADGLTSISPSSNGWAPTSPTQA